jgi:hypothetical protein
MYPGLCSIELVNRLFDPEPIKAQISNLIADRERLDRAIESLQTALRSVEGSAADQSWFNIDIKASDTTLHDAVKRAAMAMIDGINRQRVMKHIEREHPFLKPKSPSVGASLINLAKGDNPMLKIAIEGKGRSPSFYSTEGTTVIKLAADEIKGLLDDSAIKGSGGWQSLWKALVESFNKSKGEITLTPQLRGRLYHYYHDYGTGGWQDKARRVFRRELPHLFVA